MTGSAACARCCISIPTTFPPPMWSIGLRARLSSVPGAMLYLQAYQDIQVGGRGSAAQYQYTLSDENLNELNTWAPRLEARAKTMPELRDVSTDQQDQGLAANLVIDRDAASRLGITPPPSTACSTTPLASAKSPPCTPGSTSTSW